MAVGLSLLVSFCVFDFVFLVVSLVTSFIDGTLADGRSAAHDEAEYGVEICIGYVGTLRFK